MLEFLKKEFWKSRAKKRHINKSKCVVLPVIEDKNELENDKYYLVLHKSGYIKSQYYILDYKWSKKYDCFLSGGEPCCKFEEVIVLDRSSDRAMDSLQSNNFLTYDPRTINALDLQELKEITFNAQDENSASDDVWEMLISYFDERGLSD